MGRIKYNINYFIRKFSAIPENKWTTFEYGENDIHCVFGHCGMRKKDISIEGNAEAEAFVELFDAKVRIVQINDGYNCHYQQLTSKARILAALYDLKAEEAIKETLVIINEMDMVT